VIDESVPYTKPESEDTDGEPPPEYTTPEPPAEYTTPEPPAEVNPEPEAPKPEPEAPKPEPAVVQPSDATDTSIPPQVLSGPAPKGSKVIEVASNADFNIGEEIIIDPGTAFEERNKIVGFGSLVLQYPLKYDHGAGAQIVPVNKVSGATASLDAAGFKAVTSLCCPPEMENFFNRFLSSKNYEVCSVPHIQGLMHWFSCVPGMDFQYMIDVIENGNPCKYWSPKGTDCPALSSQCAGKWCR